MTVGSHPSTPLDIEKLRLFVQVARLGSLTRAAGINNSTQSVVSRQIAALEKFCGAPLLRRTGRGVLLTSFGEHILPEVVSMLSTFDALSLDLRRNAVAPAGPVSLSMVSSLAQPVLPILFRRLALEFPSIRLTCNGTSSAGIDEALASGTLDVGVPYRYDHVPAGEQAIATADTYLIGPAGDAITAGETVDFAMLDGLPLVAPPMPNGLRVKLEEVARQQRIKCNVILDASSVAIQREMAVSGCAHTLFSSNALEREVAAGLAQASRIVNPGIERIITVAVTSYKTPSRAARAVAALIADIMTRLVVEGSWHRPPSNGSLGSL